MSLDGYSACKEKGGCGMEREAGLVVKSWYPELDELLDGFAPGEVALVISSSEFEEGHFGPLGAEFAMHMAYEAGLAKARVTVASLAVEPEWAAEWLKAEALLHDQGKVIDAMLGNGDDDLSGFAAKKLEKLDVRYLCRDEMTFAAIGSELAYPAALKPGFLAMVGCLSCESAEAVEIAAKYVELVGAMARDTHASAVLSLDVGPDTIDLSSSADEIAANVHAALSDVTGLCDAVLVVCPGEEEPYDPDDIGAALTRREPHPVCHVLKSATGATGTAELRIADDHKGTLPSIVRRKS